MALILTLADMLKAANFAWVDSTITEENFPVNPECFTTKGTEIVHIRRAVTAREVLIELDHRSLRPATIEELLAYGTENPDKRTIVALGSSWACPCGYRDVPFLDEDAGGRGLNVDHGDPEYRWGGYVQFLAVSKSVFF